MKTPEKRYELYLVNLKKVQYSNSSEELCLLLPFDICGEYDHYIWDTKEDQFYLNGSIVQENDNERKRIQNLRNLCKKAKELYFSDK